MNTISIRYPEGDSLRYVTREGEVIDVPFKAISVMELTDRVLFTGEVKFDCVREGDKYVMNANMPTFLYAKKKVE